MPLVRRTRATFRSAEFGFFGVMVVTRTHTPRLNGAENNTGRFFKTLKPRWSAGAFDFSDNGCRPFRNN